MERFISRENIKRFKEQLTHPVDEQQKRTLRYLLEAEEAHLRALEAPSISTIDPSAASAK